MPKDATKTDERVLRLEAPLELSAGKDAPADTLPGKFSGLAYGGALVASRGVVVDLASTRIAPRLPLLDAHMRSDIIGRVNTLSIDQSAWTMPIEGELFSDVAECAGAVRIAKLAKRGAPYQLSIGLFDYTEEFIPRGASLTVNGQSVPGPAYVLRNGLVREVSVVTLGADTQADASFFSQPGSRHPATEDDEMTIEQLTAKVGELTALLAAKDAEIAGLRSADAERAKAARSAAVDALLSETGEKPSDAERAELLAMPEGAFAAFAASQRRLAQRLKTANPALFSDLASGDLTDPNKQPPKAATFSVDDVYANRRKAMVGA